jgi:hypothetical protein
VGKNRTAMVGNQGINEFTLVGEPRDKPVTANRDRDGPKRPDRMLRRTYGRQGKLP